MSTLRPYFLGTEPMVETTELYQTILEGRWSKGMIFDVQDRARFRLPR